MRIAVTTTRNPTIQKARSNRQRPLLVMRRRRRTLGLMALSGYRRSHRSLSSLDKSMDITEDPRGHQLADFVLTAAAVSNSQAPAQGRLGRGVGALAARGPT